MDSTAIVERLSQLSDQRFLKKYLNGGLNYRELIGVDSKLAMCLSLQATICLIVGNVAAGHETRARQLMEEHNQFCADLTAGKDA